MNTRYKITISNKIIYKEFELSPEMNSAKIGTEIDCDFRIRKDLFFEPVCLSLTRKNDKWIMMCSDNLYISTGDVRKLITKEISHGDNLLIKYQSSNNDLFNFEFNIDFNDGNIKYERAFDISNQNSITIGTDFSSNIVLRSNYTNNESLVLTRKGLTFLLKINKTFNGVYHNGKLAKSGEVIENGDFLSVSDCFFYIKDNKLWTEKGSLVSSSSIGYSDNPDLNTYPKFERNTRIKTTVSDEKIEILDPPAKPEKQKESLITRLLPSVGMLAGAGVMAMMGGLTMLIFSGVSAVMAIVTAIIGMRNSKKEYKEAKQKRYDQYTDYIEGKKKEINEKRGKELKNLEEIYISPDVEKDNFATFSPDLFDRNRDDDDFLSVRLGSGEVESLQEINYKKQEKLEVEDELQKIPGELCEEYKNIKNAPVTCDFKSAGAVGIVGEPDNRFELFKNVILDLIARHHYTDLNLFFVAENENKDKVRWLRFLPFVYNEVTNLPNIVCDDESKNIVFEYLYKELTNREQEKVHENHLVVFLYDEYGFRSHPISKFVKNAKDLDVTFVFFGDNASKISNGCKYIINVESNSGKLYDVEDKNKTKDFAFNNISDKDARKIIDFMSPVYTEDVSLESTLTKNISLFDLLQIISVEDINLTSRWKTSKVFKSMNAPIGVSKTGVIGLDLHDKAHGPHGLVAGTTGSGKSEILQTYILSMITLFHPYEVGFVIIDFKGGGMVNQFKNVPHLLGAITNIDGKAIERSLKSIKAELNKRQKYFADADVNHIDKYIKKYKNGEVKNPLPHLIIIVDEFAELKAEQPEFMKELISAARIGRSLGVHLILATQKPSGQVDDQIWSNSKFKLCLKVQDQSDSNEVLKSPLAAEIKEPGRAYLQVGNNEIFELFQSAYSGASDKLDETSEKEFKIFSVSESGRRTCVYERKKSKKNNEDSTQLNAIVDYVYNYCKQNNIEKLPDICLPALENRLNYKKYDIESLSVPVGIYDDPDSQLQDVFGINIFSENTLIIGSSMSGKTNLLQTIIRGIAEKYSSNEVIMYIIDFASMVLKNFETLNHVGGVVISNEEEKLKNLFRLLYEEIESRKEKMLSVGVSNYLSYKESGKDDIPQIVVIVDNITALKELYLNEEDLLLPICRDGISVGISVIIANSQTSGIGYKYFSSVNQRLSLFCNDSSEYAAVFDHCSLQPDNTPGRCLIKKENNIYEGQTFVSFDGEREIERTEAISSFVAEVNSKNKAIAKKIPIIPEYLFNNTMIDEFGAVSDDEKLFIGLDFADVSPVNINYNKQDLIAISGNKNNSCNSFKNFLKKSVLNIESDVFILDDYSGFFEDVSNHENVWLYSRNTSDIEEILKTIKSELVKRYTEREMKGLSAIQKMKPIVLFVNSIDAAEYISDNISILSIFKEIIKKYKGLKSLIIFSNLENDNISYNSPDVLKIIKDNSQFIVFEDINDVHLFDVPIPLLRKFKNPLNDNEGYFLSGSVLKKIKTITEI